MKKYLRYLFIILLYIYILLFFMDFIEINFLTIHLCDGGSITDNINDNDSINDNIYEYNIQENLTKLSTINKIRCKIHWYIIAKRKGKFNSYKEFKTSWNPKTHVWNENRMRRYIERITKK